MRERIDSYRTYYSVKVIYTCDMLEIVYAYQN